VSEASKDVGVRVLSPTESYFFLEDSRPHDARTLANSLREREILLKPFNDDRLGIKLPSDFGFTGGAAAWFLPKSRWSSRTDALVLEIR
jgi:hypothetical protein